MNKEEIKEILELYKNEDIEYYNLVSDLGYDKLLDYITNLQEELDFIKEDANDILYKLTINEERINRAIRYIEENICDIEYVKKKYNRRYFDIVTSSREISDILNILKGDE